MHSPSLNLNTSPRLIGRGLMGEEIQWARRSVRIKVRRAAIGPFIECLALGEGVSPYPTPYPRNSTISSLLEMLSSQQIYHPSCDIKMGTLGIE
ncbi:hypothetical protein CEXT_603901 [Caerostris extrusa]|uniref:Uncharacterized protein n=1 Tax=Caerostris extrusa TaxID=172846 RepID=A0AAV4SWV2_CAEEX|nr:hypothetical protein CEXT_603901 [Caerostris extrusa]